MTLEQLTQALALLPEPYRGLQVDRLDGNGTTLRLIAPDGGLLTFCLCKGSPNIGQPERYYKRILQRGP
jgi:hypothetical protein